MPHIGLSFYHARSGPRARGPIARGAVEPLGSWHPGGTGRGPLRPRDPGESALLHKQRFVAAPTTPGTRCQHQNATSSTFGGCILVGTITALSVTEHESQLS